jgi:membrane protease YdiL (CAAX protease family)
MKELLTKETLKELKNTDLKPFFIAVVAAFSLTGIRFFAGAYKFDNFESLFSAWGLQESYEKLHYYLTQSSHTDAWQLVYWALASSAFYFIPAILVIRLVFKDKIQNYGLKIKGMFTGWKIYVAMYLFMLPLIYVMSRNDEFLNTYPFYRIKSKDDLLPYLGIWEVAYIIQFIALEFFFRGFLVLGLKEKLGIYSICVMIIPYCMIHFSKPLPECVGSIFAGLILGWMSYKTNSVIMGAMLHISVALSMDFLSLWHRGLI